MSKQGNLKNSVQKFGRFLSGMVMPNIGAFIAWGFITALFIARGYFPNEKLATMVDPILKYLLPILIAYTGGKMVGGERGAVMGAISVMGVVVGAEIPMLLGAMLMGPLGGFVIKKFDQMVEGKIKTGFEMLVNNFSIGILGMLLAILGYYAVGPFVTAITGVLEAGVNFLVSKGLLPLVSLFVEPGKILFLNNAINHGIFSPIGANQVSEAGKSIMYLIEANPGPGLGILLAYFVFGKGDAKSSSPGAMIIHFFGGIHEIYFPYVLMNPALLLAVIGGGVTGVLTNSVLNAGLVAPASPGSIIAILSMAAKGSHIPVIISVVLSALVAFVIAAFFVKRAATKGTGQDLDAASKQLSEEKAASKGQKVVTGKRTANEIKKIVFACDAGMGSSAMGASKFRNLIKDYPGEVTVVHSQVSDIPQGTDVVVTHQNLVGRLDENAGYEIIAINNFLSDKNIDELKNRFI